MSFPFPLAFPFPFPFPFPLLSHLLPDPGHPEEDGGSAPEEVVHQAALEDQPVGKVGRPGEPHRPDQVDLERRYVAERKVAENPHASVQNWYKIRQTL